MFQEKLRNRLRNRWVGSCRRGCVSLAFVIMAVLYHALGICVIFTVLGQWFSVAAVSNGSSGITLSPSSSVSIEHGSSLKGNSTSKAPNATTSRIASSPHIPSTHHHSNTSSPHIPSSHHHNNTSSHHHITASQNGTTISSHSMTTMPSHHVTVTSSHHMTVVPHSKTIVPSHNMTIMPSSTHTVTPTSSVHPTLPPPKAGNFTLKENKTVCLFAYMAATFDVMIDSKTMPGIVLPVNATATGACDKLVKEPFITLQWHAKERSYNFTMHFVKVKSKGLEASVPQRWAAANLTFSLSTTIGGPVAATFHSKTDPLEQLSAKVGHAYQCTTSATKFKLMATNSTVNVSLTQIEFQPFDVKGGHLSTDVDVCATPPPSTAKPPSKSTPTSKKESHVVAIAVGCTLAGLIVIAAVGYLISRRRRNSSAGYRKL